MSKELNKRVAEQGAIEERFDKLSGRELEVLTLIGQGYRQSEIAQQLCLSPRTVETHLNNIRLKLGVKSSRDLTRAAIQFANPG